MPTLYISEYSSVATLPNATGQVPQAPALARQKVAIGVSNQVSTNFQRGTRMVRLHTDAICQVVIDIDPDATTIGDRMVVGQTEFHGVPEGGQYAAAVISTS